MHIVVIMNPHVVVMIACIICTGVETGESRRGNLTDVRRRVINSHNGKGRISKGRIPVVHKEKNEKKVVQIFRNANNTRPMFQHGSLAVLDCIIENPDRSNVTWRRQGTGEPLTYNFITLDGDKRFLVKKSKDPHDMSLRIRFTKNSDRGKYECFVRANYTDADNTTKEIEASIFVTLDLKRFEVAGAHAEIIGGNATTVKAGSPLRLSCVLRSSIEPPMYIFWYKEDRVINYELEDGATVRQGRQGSELIFPQAAANHSGNYSCVPSNADQTSITVAVL